MYAKVGLVETFYAGAVVAENRIIKHGSGDKLAVQAAAGADKLIGVAGVPKGVTVASGEPFDVIRSGVANVEYGGTVARGDVLTADADGRAIVATDGSRVIGIAQVSGVSGDLGGVLIQLSTHYIP
jgi:hypothetical protein